MLSGFSEAVLRSRNLAFLTADCAEACAGIAFAVLAAVHITDVRRIFHAHFLMLAVGIKFFCLIVVMIVFQILADKISIRSGSRLVGSSLEPDVIADILIGMDDFYLTHLIYSLLYPVSVICFSVPSAGSVKRLPLCRKSDKHTY